jgi:hypothetical protein
MQNRDILSSITGTLISTMEMTQEAVFSTTSALITAAMQAAAQLEKAKLQLSAATTTADAVPAKTAVDSTIPVAAKPETEKKKKSRPSTAYKANITASISLEDEKFRTLNTLSTAQYIKTFFSRTKPAKYIDDGIDICSELVTLESGINKELENKDTKNPETIEALQVRKIELVKNQIIEHAARRADLFFYLLTAVHGSNVLIEENGGAEKQHGKGSQARGTAACHSFPFANFKVSEKTTLQHSTLLDNTYLIEALNSTVELPNLSNSFDGHLEGRYQRTSFIKDCMAILNKAAKSEIDPAQGMNEFYEVMDDFFRSFYRKYLVTNKKTIEDFKAVNLIWQYQKEGTFSGRDVNTHKIDKAYLHMMLKINSYTNIMPYSYYYTKIQREILESKMGAKPVRPAP